MLFRKDCFMKQRKKVEPHAPLGRLAPHAKQASCCSLPLNTLTRSYSFVCCWGYSYAMSASFTRAVAYAVTCSRVVSQATRSRLRTNPQSRDYAKPSATAYAVSSSRSLPISCRHPQPFTLGALQHAKRHQRCKNPQLLTFGALPRSNGRSYLVRF